MKAKIIGGIIACSYNGCLIIGMAAIILYMAGLEKCRKVPIISLILYLLINVIGKSLI